MTRWWLVCTCLLGCGDNNGVAQDAPVAKDAAVDAPPVPFNCMTSPSAGTHKIFLAFDGVALTAGSPSDATTNAISFFDPSVSTTTRWWCSAASHWTSGSTSGRRPG